VVNTRGVVNHCGWSPDHSLLLETDAGDRDGPLRGLCSTGVACWACWRGSVALLPLRTALSPAAGGARGEDVTAVELRLQSSGSALPPTSKANPRPHPGQGLPPL
jgi:hypothetical protein